MKNVIITGATKGIGRAISLAFAAEGLNLALCARSHNDLLALRDEIKTLSPAITVLIRATDCSVKDDVRAFAGFAEQELGPISIIVNNVGLYEYSSILDDDDDVFEKLINTNVMPSYELYRYFGKTMMAAGYGHIFNICSVAAIAPVTEAGTYTVTKYAQLGLSNIMRLEMQAYGVKVTTILPGSTLTDSWKGTILPTDSFVLPNDISAAIICAYKMSAGANVDEIIIKPFSGQV